MKVRIKKVGLETKPKPAVVTPAAPRRKSTTAKGPAEPAPPPPDRDGLVWLIEKGKLKGERRSAALAYREAFRDAGGVSVPSSLSSLDRVQGGGFNAQLTMAIAVSACSRIQEFRQVALHGQEDLLTVADGVCGCGHTLRTLAGRDGPRSMVMMGMLLVALDLIAAYVAEGERKAA
jgi:hypothetical protein